MSSEAKWTPGPWTAYPDIGGNCFFIAQQDGAPYTPDYSDVCGLYCRTWSGERFTVQQANAHLIAAAPDLYEALSIAVKDGPAGYTEWLDYAEQALATARGEKA